MKTTIHKNYPLAWPKEYKNPNPHRSQRKNSNINYSIERLRKIMKKMRVADVYIYTNKKWDTQGNFISSAQTFHNGVTIIFSNHGRMWTTSCDYFDCTIANLDEIVDSMEYRYKEKQRGINYSPYQSVTA